MINRVNVINEPELPGALSHLLMELPVIFRFALGDNEDGRIQRDRHNGESLLESQPL